MIRLTLEAVPKFSGFGGIWICTVWEGARIADEFDSSDEREALDWAAREWPGAERMPDGWRPWNPGSR